VQDVRGISPDGSRWTYYGLHILENGERLTIFAPDSITPERQDGRNWYPPTWKPVVLWNGTIKRTALPGIETEGAFGMRIHWDQAGLEREVWARYFFDALPCRLVRSATTPYRPGVPRVIGHMAIDAGKYDGLTDNGGPRQLLFFEDGTIRWELPPMTHPGAADSAGAAEDRRMDNAPPRLMRAFVQHQGGREARVSAAQASWDKMVADGIINKDGTAGPNAKTKDAPSGPTPASGKRKKK
jgi:hypothetical protein